MTLVCACILSRSCHVWLFMPPWTAAGQAPLSTGFSRQKYWNGLPCPSSGIFPIQRSNSHLLLLKIPLKKCSLIWQTLFYCSPLYCTSQILCSFLQIEGLWYPCVQWVSTIFPITSPHFMSLLSHLWHFLKYLKLIILFVVITYNKSEMT